MTETQDAQTEMLVLQRVLDHHPGHLKTEELSRELGGERPDFDTRDKLELAIRELVGAGLLHRTSDDFLVPSRAAVYFAELAQF